MSAITITQLENAALDAETIGNFANSALPTVTDRLGVTKPTITGLSAEYPNASINAAAAAGSASTATAQALLADAARVLAEAARDSANTSGKVFTAAEGTAAGIAATTTGLNFSVLNTAGTKWDIYRNSAGVALLIGPGSYTAGYIDTFIDTSYDDDPATLYVLVDPVKRILAKWIADGTLIAKLGIALGITNGLTFTRSAVDGKYTLGLGTVEGELPVATSLLRGAYDNEDALFVLTDSAGRKLLTVDNDGTLSGKITSTEVVTARGSRTTLDARLSQNLNAYGQPKRHQWGEWYTRETRQRLRKRLLAESAQLVIAAIGDSWTHNRDRWCAPVAATLKATYGNAGSGWVGFGYGSATPFNLQNGNVNSADAALVHTGSWLKNYGTSISPDICDVYTATPGDKMTVSFLGTGNTSAVNLYYVKGAGVARYRWNAGAWATADLTAGTGLGVLALTGFPTGTWALEIENVSGTTTMCGVDLQQTADGVRWHKLGATGSRASQWVGVDATQWQAGITALAPNLITVMLSTNDQSAYDASTYKTHIQTLITRIKAALPLADIVLICPCENGRANTYPMTDYATALYELAATNKCGFIDLQYVFGETFSEYASTSPRAWFNADLIHPEPLTGGRVIADVVARFLTTV